jgi:TonB-dependent starch-binding outer membrane protein SusC
MKKFTHGVLGLVLASSVSVAYAQTAVKKDTVKAKTKDIEEVVVVAFGKQKKELVIGSSTAIKAKDFQQRATVTFDQALDGTVAGLQVALKSGNPGKEAKIVIRGASSVQFSNDPVIIVDGVPYTSGAFSLNNADIETMTVLKDAASTALYGSEAANGVILITTKTGKANSSSLTYNSQIGIGTYVPNQYKKVNAAQHYEKTWEFLRNQQLDLPTPPTFDAAGLKASQTLITANLASNIYNVPNDQVVLANGKLNPNAKQIINGDLDWGQFLRTAMNNSHNIAYSGGTEKTTYFGSVGYDSFEGYAYDSSLERFNARVKIDSQVKPWLKLGVNLYATASTTKGSDRAMGDTFDLLNNMAPIYPAYQHNPDGSVVYKNGQVQYYKFPNHPSTSLLNRNLLQEAILDKRNDRDNAINSRAYAEFKLHKDLTFTTNVGYDVSSTYRSYQNNNIVGGAALNNGDASKYFYYSQQIYSNQILNYKKNFGKHGVDMIVAHEASKKILNGANVSRSSMVNENNEELSNYITLTSGNSYTDTYSKEGYFSRLNYDYNQRYLLTLNLRRDASSKFHPNSRWKNTWSVGLGWNLHKEGFLRNVSSINNLKLRTSYGQIGNDGGSTDTSTYYFSQGVFQTNNNGNLPGLSLKRPANDKLTWEISHLSNIGLDFGFLNNRINGTLEVYRKTTEDMLITPFIPYNYGILGTLLTQNAGAVRNQGIELSLNLGLIRSNRFDWDLNINATSNTNKVIDLPPASREKGINITGTQQLIIGQDINGYYVHEWLGVDKNTGYNVYALDPTKDTAANLYYKLPSGEQIAQIYTNEQGQRVTNSISLSKVSTQGSPTPDLYGSFNNTFRFDRFKLSTLFNYQIGGKIYDSAYAGLVNISSSTSGGAYHEDVLRSWQKPGDITDIPKISTVTNNLNSNATNGSSRWLVDASYISFRSATLSYDVPKEFTEEIGIKSLSLSANVENIWFKTARQGLYPSGTINGATVSGADRYAPPRTYTFGVNLGF